jgi:hypothetical protein
LISEERAVRTILSKGLMATLRSACFLTHFPPEQAQHPSQAGIGVPPGQIFTGANDEERRWLVLK